MSDWEWEPGIGSAQIKADSDAQVARTEMKEYIEKVTKLERGDVFEGISYPIQLRVTPARDAEGLAADWREVMWSADLLIEEGVSLTASAGTPETALDKLQDVIANHTRPFPDTKP